MKGVPMLHTVMALIPRRIGLSAVVMAVLLSAAPCAFAVDQEKKDAKSDKDVGQRRKDDVGKNEELSFLQFKVAGQMTELEERMFRLSEALKSLEPENASRLLIG